MNNDVSGEIYYVKESKKLQPQNHSLLIAIIVSITHRLGSKLLDLAALCVQWSVPAHGGLSYVISDPNQN